MDSVTTDREKLIALANAANAVLKTKAAADNLQLRRTVKAAAVHTGREIRMRRVRYE